MTKDELEDFWQISSGYNDATLHTTILNRPQCGDFRAFGAVGAENRAETPDLGPKLAENPATAAVEAENGPEKP